MDCNFLSRNSLAFEESAKLVEIQQEEILLPRSREHLSTPPPSKRLQEEGGKFLRLISKCNKLYFSNKIKKTVLKVACDNPAWSELLTIELIEKRLNNYVKEIVIRSLFFGETSSADLKNRHTFNAISQLYTSVIFEEISSTSFLIDPILDRLKELKDKVLPDTWQMLEVEIEKCQYTEPKCLPFRSKSSDMKQELNKEDHNLLLKKQHYSCHKLLEENTKKLKRLSINVESGLSYFLASQEKRDQQFSICVAKVLDREPEVNLIKSIKERFQGDPCVENIRLLVEQHLRDYINMDELKTKYFLWDGTDQGALYMPFKRIAWDEAMRRFKSGQDPEISIITSRDTFIIPKASSEASVPEILTSFFGTLLKYGLFQTSHDLLNENEILQILTFFSSLAAYSNSSESIWQVIQNITSPEPIFPEILVDKTKQELAQEFEKFSKLTRKQRYEAGKLMISLADLLLMCSACGFMRAGWYIRTHFPQLTDQYRFKIQHDVRASILLDDEFQYRVMYKFSLHNEREEMDLTKKRLIDGSWSLIPISLLHNNEQQVGWYGGLELILPSQFLGVPADEDIVFSWDIHNLFS